MLARRTLIGARLAGIGAPAFAACPAVLRRPIARAGGEGVLRAVKALRWTGTARVFASAGVIALGVSTVVRPFVSARSESWRLSEGPTMKRTLIIDEKGGRIEFLPSFAVAWRAMPEPQLTHERQQYGLYGLMLLAPACAGATYADKHVWLQHGDAPRTGFLFHRDGTMQEARNEVVSPEAGEAPISQVIRFTGTIAERPVRWPRTIAISQGGKPYFELTLDSFAADLA